MGRGYGSVYGPPGGGWGPGWGWGRGGGWGRGWGRGGGWGRGWGRGGGWGPGGGWGYGGGPWYGADPWYGAGPYGAGTWGAAPTVEGEAAFLKEEAESVRTYLEGIERRISELEKPSK